ncbi:MAG: murein biosynthesis integral membrane protein MurJ [Spirochaetia bacterium]|nr:murein biosynthesis integral membrane protein MurJ [Spirochaetia bacterium]
MLCTMFSRILGFVKIVIIGAVFGGSGKADVLNAVFNIPNNLRKLMAEGALSSSFIPVLAGSLANREPHDVTRKIVRNIMAFQIVVLIPLCILSIIFSDFLVNKVLLDFADPALQELAVSLFRWFISYILLISISAVLLGVLNVHGYFTIPALTPILFSIAVILSILCLHRSMGVYSMAVGVLAGGVLQILFQCPLFKKLGYDFKFSFDFRNEKFRRIMVNWFPVLATSCIFAINQQIAMRFASGLETGSSSAISYALVFWQLPFGIFSASITTVLFPQMSKEGATGQLAQLTDTLTTGIVSLMGLLIPSSLIMYFLGYDIISIGMQRGSFTVDNTAMAGFVLQGYAWGLLGTGAFNFIQRYYYSLNNYKKPFFFAVLCATMDVLLSLWLKETPLRVAGLAWANTISFTLGTCFMLADIKLHSKLLSVTSILKDLAKILISVSVGIIPVLVYLYFCSSWWHDGASLRYLGAFLAVCAVFAAVVLALYKVLKLDALFMLWLRRRKRSS